MTVKCLGLSKCVLNEGKDILIIRSQSCRCQCPGDVRGQAITGHHIDLGVTDYFMILIYSLRFTHLQPGADPGGSCRPVAWRCQLSIKGLGTRFTAWRRTCVFFADRSVTFQGHICPSSCGKLRSFRIGAPVTDPCARQSVDTKIRFNCTHLPCIWDSCVIDIW